MDRYGLGPRLGPGSVSGLGLWSRSVNWTVFVVVGPLKRRNNNNKTVSTRDCNGKAIRLGLGSESRLGLSNGP